MKNRLHIGLLQCLLGVSLCLGHNALLAQKSIKPNALFIEAGGLSIGYGLKYNRVLFHKGCIGATLEAGYSPNYIGGDALNHTVAGQTALIIGKQKHFGEIGCGAFLMHTTFFRHSYRVFSAKGVAITGGYRYQPPASHFFFRVELTPLGLFSWYNGEDGDEILFIGPWGGIGVGIAF